VCDSNDPTDYIASCAFYEGTGNEWLERDLVFTGHRRGVVNVWSKAIQSGGAESWTLKPVKRLNHVDQFRNDGVVGNVNAAITCILPMAQIVYTGDEDGKVVSSRCLTYCGNGACTNGIAIV
jgi:hypothetical protein